MKKVDKKEEVLNYDQLMALFSKMALDSKRRDEEYEKKRRIENEAYEEKRRIENEAYEKERLKEKKEYEERMKKLEKLVGGMGENTGHYAEEFFQNAFAKSPVFAGIKFDKVIPNLMAQKKESCEFDIVLVNGDTVAIIEAKNRVHPDFVKELVTVKLEQFRSFFPEYANYKVYLGIAGLSFDKTVAKKAHEYGVCMVRQDGKAIEIDADGVKVY